MPDFSARFTSGVSLETWVDPDAISPARIGRLNPAPQRPPRFWRGTLHEPIAFAATVEGVEGPADAALDGRLFMCWFAEHEMPRPNIVAPLGFSSMRSFVPRTPGHYTIVFRRKLGGGIILHVDVASPE